jgi:hypothetical protein
MLRPARARALLPLALLAVMGCQDYNFNPVGHCLVQPGSEQVTLSNLSTADILFVVDDSGSMSAEQQKLASNFDYFISNLDAENANRAAKGLLPIDFHIAITTTSVYWNYQNFSTCSSSCGGSSGSLVCCTGSNTPVLQPQKCGGPSASCPAGTACSNKCLRPGPGAIGMMGDYYCCDSSGNVPATAMAPLACETPGAACGSLDHHYDFTGCGGGGGGAAGVAVDQYPYPQGDFVSLAGTSVNPRVLHFDKQLYPQVVTGSEKNRQGFTRAQLVDFFKSNVLVGTCGSGQEQGLQGGRLGVEKAIGGQQKDTYTLTGATAWDATNRVASAPAEWPHPNSKLVVVFIGDEDDCSAPNDPSGIVMIDTDQAGNDACTRDAALDPTLQKEYAVSSFVDYLAGLGHPLGAAFIESASQTSCGSTDADVCLPGICCQMDCPASPGVCTTSGASGGFCGGQAPGKRFFTAADGMKAHGADVVEGSICDSNFGAILTRIAEIVKPPSSLTLSTQPAEGAITLLRIATANGVTRKVCTGPAPAGTSGADLGKYDWWFTATGKTGDTTPVTVSEFIYINHDTGNCEASPGETYAANYIAQIPTGGCTSDAQCASALGGVAADWSCYTPPGMTTGTCTCK